MKNKKCFVQLGRIGDILNALPLAYYWWKNHGIKPYFMVAKEFSSVVDRAWYVEKVVFDGPFEEIFPALHQARQLTSDISLCQIYGNGMMAKSICDSFARESWFRSGIDIPWGSEPLMLDRNTIAETNLLLTYGLTEAKKLILVSTVGTSSPFPHGPDLLRRIYNQFRDEYTIVDLSKIKADNFVDLLALYEIAAYGDGLLVTIDTGHLHLAHAVPNLNVISLITRDPNKWHGSPWTHQQKFRYYYDEFPEKLIDIIHKITYVLGSNFTNPVIYHTFADWRKTEPDEETIRRKSVAVSSWNQEYENGLWRRKETDFEQRKRDARNISDPHPVPYARDVIENAAFFANTNPKNIIALTNADVGFCPGLTGKIIEAVQRHGAAYTHRRDFKRIEKPFHSEGQVKHGQFYPGSDGFFFSVAWWKEHGCLFGDFVMGREYWDEVLRQIIKYTGGVGIEFGIWHEWHDSFWCGKERESLPGNLYNKELRAKWFKETGFVPEDFRYYKVIENGHMHPWTKR